MPARRQGAGLRLAVAHDTSDEQVRIVEGRSVCVRERVAELAALVDRARGLRCDVARNPARKRELPEELAQSRRVAPDVRIDLAVGPFQIGIRDQPWAAVSWPGDVEHVERALPDRAVQVDVDQIQPRRRAEVAQQARLDLLCLERLVPQRVVEQIDLPDREVVGGSPVGVDPVQFPGGERRLRCGLGAHQLFARSGRNGGATRMRASTATQRSPLARIGLRSSSAISGRSSTKRASRCSSSVKAALLTAGRPRKPRTSSPALPNSTSSRASPSVSGAIRKPVPPINSAITPPGPNATSGPNTGSCTAPARNSTPVIIGCTSSGGPIRSAASRTASSRASPSATPPSSVLCAPVRAVLTTTGYPSSRAAATASSSVTATRS